MAITPIQAGIDTKHRHYLEAEGAVKTDNNVKPLPPQGHLVHDRLLVMPKYFIKDFGYDMQAIKAGLQGKANDHQTGRLNDVGLKLAGIGIATTLAARTTNPLARIMEYAGLGSFLFAMSAFPKIAIQAPTRAIHGFDPGIEYIDDQGRKKSMYQDPNYIPFDMYRKERTSEDLQKIGDGLGIPRGIQNYEDIVKEQARKVGIQNNTLWMLTAGTATPILTALTCFGLERVISPVLENVRNSRYNSKIANALEKTSNMAVEIDKIETNKLSKEVEKILSSYKGQELPQIEFDSIVDLLSRKLDNPLQTGIKEDLDKLFNNGKFLLNENSNEELSGIIKKSLTGRNKIMQEAVFMPTEEELNRILASKEVSAEEIAKIKQEFKSLFLSKMEKQPPEARASLEATSNQVIENISKYIQKTPSKAVTEGNIQDITNLAKILGEFKENQAILTKCKAMKIEHEPETVIARSYGEFENELFKALNIKVKDMKAMKESPEFAKEVLDKKLRELVQDDAKYSKAISRLANVMDKMDTKLHGDTKGSAILDLINAIENNYNNTAKRLENIGHGKYSNLINKLVKEDVSTLSNRLKSRDDVFAFLDGVLKAEKKEGIEEIKLNARGVGSSKNLEIARIAKRYQGANNSLNRMLHLMQTYRIAQTSKDINPEIFKKGIEMVMGATSSDHTLKLNMVNNAELYKEVMQTIYNDKLEETTGKALDEASRNNIKSRFQKYLERFKDVLGNSNIDFTKPEHNLGTDLVDKYTKADQTRLSKFNLVAQNPIDMVQKAAAKNYGTKKWLRIVSTIGGVTLGVTLLAQAFFGKISNPHTIRRQVTNDDNK